MKKFIFIFSLVLVVLTITGCGRKNNNQNLDDYVVDKEITGPVTISFWHPFSATIGDPLQRYVDDFMVANPNITVELVKIEGGYSGLKDKVVLDIVSGDTPTMLVGYPDHVADYINGRAVISLDKFASDPTVGLSDLNDFVPAYLAENKQLGKLYSVPFNKSTEIFIYNKTYFEEHSLPDPNTLYANGEWTWDKLTEIAQQIKNLNSARPASDKFFPFSYDSSSNLFITLTRQWGGEYTNNKGELLFNNTKALEALTFYTNNHKNGLMTMPNEWETLYSSEQFTKENVYMMVGSTAGILKNLPTGQGGVYPFEVGTAPIPQKSADTKTVIQQGTNLSILANSTSQQRLAAWMLIKYLSSKDVTLDLAMNTGYLPVRVSALESTEYQNFLNNPSTDVEEKAVSAASKSAFLQVDYSKYDPAFLGSSNVRTQVGLAVENALFPKEAGMTPQKAIKDAYDELNITW